MSKKTLLFIVAALLLPTLASAAVGSTVPTVVADYGNIVTNIVKGVVVALVILIMLVFAGWEMYKNGNATPLKWAIFASIVIGGAIYFGPQIIAYMQTAIGSTSSSGASTTIS